MKVPSVHTTKLDNRRKKVVYLGREPGMKACRLYDPEVERLIVSRDVVFEETKAWEWEQQQQQETTNSCGSFTVVGSQSTEGGDNNMEGEPVTPRSDSLSTGESSQTVTVSPEIGENSPLFETSSCRLVVFYGFICLCVNIGAVCIYNPSLAFTC